MTPRVAIEEALLNLGMSHSEVTRTLAPEPQIIRTEEEANGSHSNSILMCKEGYLEYGMNVVHEFLPAVVVASGEHVRACREALEGGKNG